MMPLNTAVRRVGAPLRGFAIGLRTQSWPAHSRLFVAGDGNEWAIADDAAELTRLAQGLGVRIGPERWIARVRNQSVFHTSQFTLIGLPFERNGNRLGVAYLHGIVGDRPAIPVARDEQARMGRPRLRPPADGEPPERRADAPSMLVREHDRIVSRLR